MSIDHVDIGRRRWQIEPHGCDHPVVRENIRG